MLASKQPATTSHQHGSNPLHPSPSSSSAVPLLRRPRCPSESYFLNRASYSTQPPTTTSSRLASSLRHYQPIPPPTTAYSDALWTRSTARVADLPPSPSPPFHIHPLHPKGPPFLPPGRILKTNLPVPLPPLPPHPGRGSNEEPPDHYSLPQDQPQFTLNDFLRKANNISRAVPSKLRHAFISRENYLKMTSWFSTNIPSQGQLNTVDIEGGLINKYVYV